MTTTMATVEQPACPEPAEFYLAVRPLVERLNTIARQWHGQADERLRQALRADADELRTAVAVLEAATELHTATMALVFKIERRPTTTTPHPTRRNTHDDWLRSGS
jgi:hypothetical protein